MIDIRTADELEIRNLIAKLAFCADNPNIDDLDEYVDCFTEDGIWDMAGKVASGRAEILAGAIARRQNSLGIKGRHFVSMTLLRLDSDTAVAESYFQFVHSATKPPAIAMVGHYLDTFARTPAGWKLAHRVITFG